MTDQKPDPVQIRPFADFLREQAKGKTHEELSKGLQDLVARVRDTGKKGTITLRVTVEPMSKAPDSVLMVGDEITLKLPEHDRDTSLFFADDANNLTRNDPNQLAFDSLTVVDSTTGEVTTIPATGTFPATGTTDRK